MPRHIRPLKIGSVTCPNNLVLAPMAGITDAPFRTMCLEGGAGLVTGEMISAAALKFANPKTMKMLKPDPDEHPVSIQIFGSDEAAIEKAARMAQSAGADIVDINAGCPEKKILRSGSGALLMKDERLLARLVASAVSSVKIPVTLKLRCGWKKDAVLSPKLARAAENEGARALAVHARPVESGHEGPPDIDALAQTAGAVRIPVIGNGGVSSPEQALAMLEAGCAGVMIGRAAIGNPSIFNRIKLALEDAPHDFVAQILPGPQERVSLFLRLIRMNAARYGETAGIIRTRKVAGYWLKGFAGCSVLRNRFMSAKTLNEVNSILLKYTGNEN